MSNPLNRFPPLLWPDSNKQSLTFSTDQLSKMFSTNVYLGSLSSSSFTLPTPTITTLNNSPSQTSLPNSINSTSSNFLSCPAINPLSNYQYLIPFLQNAALLANLGAGNITATSSATPNSNWPTHFGSKMLPGSIISPGKLLSPTSPPQLASHSSCIKLENSNGSVIKMNESSMETSCNSEGKEAEALNSC